MIQPNNNLSVLPWYKYPADSFDTNLWNSMKSFAYGDIFPFVCPANTLLPFQIIRPHDDNLGFDEVNIMQYGPNGMSENIVFEMMDAGLQIVPFPDLGYDIIVFPAIFQMSLGLSEGRYYLDIFDSAGNSWYSDIFTVVHDVSGYLKIEWWDVDNLTFDSGMILYTNPQFKNRIYLCTELGKPEYVFEEEGEERDGYFFREKQISEKTFRCVALAPEYLCDVMRFIRMSDFVEITDQYGRVYRCDSFLMTPKWQTQGDLASVEIEFQTDTVVKKIGRGYIRDVMGGDFNKDFNDDYKIL